MKFGELQRGVRFRYAGRIYVKTGPLTASDEETGAQRMIPRYAPLQPLADPEANAGPQAGASLLEVALAAFRRETDALFDELEATPAQRARLAQACEALSSAVKQAQTDDGSRYA